MESSSDKHENCSYLVCECGFCVDCNVGIYCENCMIGSLHWCFGKYYNCLSCHYLEYDRNNNCVCGRRKGEIESCDCFKYEHCKCGECEHLDHCPTIYCSECHIHCSDLVKICSNCNEKIDIICPELEVCYKCGGDFLSLIKPKR
jgi:hypothetical protein